MSAAPIFSFANAASRAVSLTADSEAGGMPAAYLQDARRSALYRSGAVSTVNLAVTLQSGESVDVLGLVDHILPVDGTIRVQSWSDAIGGSVQVLDQTFSAWPTGVVPSPPWRSGFLGLLSAPLSSLYWQVTLSGTGLAYQQASILWLGERWQPAQRQQRGWPLSRRPITTWRHTPGGQRYGRGRLGPLECAIQYDWLTPEERHELFLRYTQVEDRTPFLFCANPDGGRGQLESLIYGTFDGQASGRFSERTFLATSAPARIVEALT
ncbi:MAG: hypothetical protein AUJ55_05470 [Proteobacteria bacterium CG1_02_64_396]|nr:MAG: hypothetical protein AUJ55_05470 [Proteobacteria bacterium CG1_02_64_396]